MGHVGAACVEVVPDLAVAVKGADAVALPDHAVPAKVPDRALVLEVHGHRHREPVRRVIAPEEPAPLVNHDILEVLRDHGRVDVVNRARKNNDALGPALVVERVQQRRPVVAAVCGRLEVAEAPALLLCSLHPIAFAGHVWVGLS